MSGVHQTTDKVALGIVGCGNMDRTLV